MCKRVVVCTKAPISQSNNLVIYTALRFQQLVFIIDMKLEHTTNPGLNVIT
jgi:hypothetical protein